MRNKKGQFEKGQSFSPKTQFKKGEHWRSKQKHWDIEWLKHQYIAQRKSTSEIASECNCTDANIIFWLKKHGIKRRTTSEAREVKHWGQSGEKNPMFGNIGSKNPRWLGGISAERNSFYSSIEWKSIVPQVFKKCDFKCMECESGHTNTNALHIHHLASFKHKDLRSDIDNLIILCEKCHRWVHSKKNTEKKYILTYEQFKNRK